MRHDRFDMKCADYVMKLRVERVPAPLADTSNADAPQAVGRVLQDLTHQDSMSERAVLSLG